MLKKKILSLILTICIVMSLAPVIAFADGDSGPEPDFVIRWDTNDGIEGMTLVDGVATFDTLTIEPEHYIVIEGAQVHVNTLTLGEGARVEVLNVDDEGNTHTGALSWNTINASNRARILMQNGENIPEGMEIYRWSSPEEGEDPFALISAGEARELIGWTEVEFTVLEDETAESGRWVWNSYDFDCFGPTEDTVVVELTVNGYMDEISGDNFPLAFPEEINEENKIFDGKRAKIRVSDNIESIAIGWQEENSPRRISVANANPDEPGGWLVMENPQGNSYELMLNLLRDDDSKENYYRVEFDYGSDSNDDGGSNNNGDDISRFFERLDDEQGAELHAYGNQELSGETVSDDENTDESDLILGWAKSLAGDFKVGEGRYQVIGEYIELTPNPEKSKEIENENVEKVRDLITCEPQGEQYDIVASNYAGESKTLEAYTLTFSVPKKSQEELKEGTQGEPKDDKYTVTTTAYMIQKEDVSSDGATYEQVVIKIGDEFYIRNAGDGENSEFVCLGANDDKDNTRAINIVTDAYTTRDEVIVFGNNASLTQEEMSDDSAKAYFVNNFWMDERDMGGKIAIYRPDFTGVFLKPDTESTLEALAWGNNTSYDIKESGEGLETDFYFGYSKAILSAITGDKLNGLKVKSLMNVEVLGDIPDNAVKVEKNNDDTFMVEFLSDYYDEVAIKLTYLLDDNTQIENTLTINRVGIVVSYGRTPGDDKTRVQIHHGHDSGEFITDNGNKMEGVIYATYYHPQGTGNIENSDTSLYVTLHYKNGTVEQKIIKADFFTKETDEHTAMSDYVVAIAPHGTNIEDTLPVKVEVIAVENADADGRFNGAKLGAGKGVQCDVNFDD